MYPAAHFLPAPGTQVLKGSNVHYKSPAAVGLPAGRPGASRREAGVRSPHAYLAPNGPPLAPLPLRGRGGGADAHWLASGLRPPPRRVYWSEQRRPRDRRWRRPSLAPALKRATRKQPPPCAPPHGLARWLRLLPTSPGSSRLLPAVSRLPPASAPAQRRRVGAATGGARSEGRPPHCPGGCPSRAPRPPGTPQGPPEAGKGGGRGPAGRGGGRAGGLRA